MKDVVLWELRRRRTAIIWWSIGSAIMVLLIVLLYPSIRDQAEQLNRVFNDLPQGVRELKTGGQNAVDVADPASFLNSQLYYITLPILWIIMTITRGSAALGKEEQSRTLELLLARPISRGRLLAAKALSLTLEMAIVAVVSFVVTLMAITFVGLHIGTGKIVLVTLYTALFSLSFGVIAFALQAASSVTRRAATVSAVAIAFGGYILTSLAGLTDWLKLPAKLMPYHYFAPQDILDGKVPQGLVIYLIATAAIAIPLAYYGFRKRDIE